MENYTVTYFFWFFLFLAKSSIYTLALLSVRKLIKISLRWSWSFSNLNGEVHKSLCRESPGNARSEHWLDLFQKLFQTVSIHFSHVSFDSSPPKTSWNTCKLEQYFLLNISWNWVTHAFFTFTEKQPCSISLQCITMTGRKLGYLSKSHGFSHNRLIKVP